MTCRKRKADHVPYEEPRAGRELATSSHARRPCALTVIRGEVTRRGDHADRLNPPPCLGDPGTQFRDYVWSCSVVAEYSAMRMFRLLMNCIDRRTYVRYSA